jgi:hypothetical protein
MKKPKPKNPPLSLKKAMNAMRLGARLVKMHQVATGPGFFVCPGGPVSRETASAIMKHPLVRGAGDSLFHGLDQTWRMVGDIVPASTL